MEIIVDRFYSNNSDLEISDILYNVKTHSENGIDTIWFETKDKYVDIETNGSTSGGGLVGNIIRIHPVILDEEGNYLIDVNLEKFLNHSDYYLLELVVTNSLNTSSIVTPLKHEYFINYIDDNKLLLSLKGMESYKVTMEEELDKMVKINQESGLYE